MSVFVCDRFKRDYDINGASEETVRRHARLTAEAPLAITGAEHQPIAVYHDCTGIDSVAFAF